MLTRTRKTLLSAGRRASVSTLLLGMLSGGTAEASPVLIAGSGTEKVHSTDITLMKKDGVSVLSVLPDYQGPFSGFAVILAVPGDVTKDRVSTLNRKYADQLKLLSAPKFAEFWEMDPCSKEEVEQDWERDLSTKGKTNFLGAPDLGPTKKVEKEMLLKVEASTKAGEYKETFIGNAEELRAWLKKKEYELPAGGDKSIDDYESRGYQFLALDVDTNRVELIGSDRASLSPIRFYTEDDVTKLPTRFGLPSAAKQQEMILYTLVPDQRIQVTNYPTKAAPTNLSVTNEYVESADKKYNLKEKMPEFYAALFDSFVAKNPKTFVLEYAWSATDCGQPCATLPLLPDEILSLGADVFEARLSPEVTRPKPPEPTAEEQALIDEQIKALKTPKEKKDAKETWEKDREELAARKALIARNEYVLTRLHYRYAADGMPNDVELGNGAPITGGVALPKGEFGDTDQTVQPSKENQFQTRYNGNFQNITVVNCEDPKPHRWGKAPRSYRGLRKIWIADDLARRDRTRIKVEGAVLSAVAELGLSGRAVPKPEKPAAAEAPKEEKGGCAVDGVPTRGNGAFTGLLGLLFGAALLGRVRSRSRV